MAMKTISDLNLFVESDYKLDALIMTSFSEFDEKRIKRYLRKANSLLSFDWNRMWLFQCNPVCERSAINSTTPIYKRIFKPNCKLHGKSIKCCDCLKECLEKEKGIPKKVFHPKVWFLRFINKEKEEDFFWKMVVSSKNMSTGAEKLVDCYFCTKGYLNKQENDYTVQSNGIERFLDDLKSSDSPQDKIDWTLFDLLIKEIKNVTWEDAPNFLYVNGDEWTNKKDLLPWSGRNIEYMKVLSPFLNEKFVHYLYGLCPKTKIYSKEETGFSSLNYKNVSKYHSYMTDVKLDDNLDWHAKIFVWKMDGKWYILLGSLNATEKAFSVNTEFGVWFEIEEGQIPKWEGDLPTISNGDDKDEASDRKIIEVFKETKAEEVSSLDQLIYKELLRKEMINEAQVTLLRRIRDIDECTDKNKENSTADKTDYNDFESFLLCNKEKIDLGIVEKTLKKIDEEYAELRDYKEWLEYINGCAALLKAIEIIKTKNIM